MGTVKRVVDSAVLTEITSQHTVPFYIVKIEFATATSFLSETQEVTFETNVYTEGAIKVGSFRWSPDGVQAGSIKLLNENDAATALVLNNLIQDTPVSIYKVYSTGPSTNTPPLLVVTGVLSGSRITPEESTIGVLTSTADTEHAPRDFFTIEEGFNHLPPTGTVVTWAGEKYVLQGFESG